MAWTWDAPSGTYKDHALSSEVREAAYADALFWQFASPESGYGKGKGQSVTITKVGKLPLASRVSETERLPSGRPAISTKVISVSEWGFKSPITETEMQYTHFGLSAKLRRALEKQLRMTMDKMVADAFKLSVYKAIPTVGGTVFDTDGTPSTQATRNLTIDDLRSIRDELAGTLKAPTWRNGKYVGILSTRAARGIKNDPEYKDWLAPTDSAPFITSRLKDVECFMLLEDNHWGATAADGALLNAIGLNGILGEAVFFGEDAVTLALVQEPELRMGLAEDLGRFKEIGWVGRVDAGIPYDLAAESRIIHVTSS